MLSWCFGKGYKQLETTEINIAFIGQTGNGQTAVIKRFVNKGFNETAEHTIGADFSDKTFQHPDADDYPEVSLKICDINTQLGLNTVSAYLTPKVDIFFLCYNIHNAESLAWIKDKFLGNQQYQSLLKNKKVVFLGCKDDLKSKVDLSKQVEELKKTIPHSSSYTCSAKTNHNIDLIFNNSIKEFIGPIEAPRICC